MRPCVKNSRAFKRPSIAGATGPVRALLLEDLRARHAVDGGWVGRIELENMIHRRLAPEFLAKFWAANTGLRIKNPARIGLDRVMRGGAAVAVVMVCCYLLRLGFVERIQRGRGDWSIRWTGKYGRREKRPAD